MSQQRVRKPAGVGDARAVTRSSVVKAAGDTVPCARPNARSRSKNKISKSIRYDLESALVGLCDVWFEEIKPHLIRNNIKLHVDASPAAGDHGAPAAVLPSVQANCCDHLDPGAAPDRHPPWTADYADSCSTRPTASRAPYRKQPVLSPSAHLQALTTRNVISLNKRRGRSVKRKPSNPMPTSSARCPLRACRTYSVVRAPPAPNDSKANKIQRNNKKLKNPRCKVKTKCSNWTQTELPYPPNDASSNITKRNSSIQCNRCPANTTISNKTKQKLQPVPDTLNLYDANLVHLISELEDKRFHLLYQSPHTDEVPSAMNLLPIPYAIPFLRRRRARALIHPPWK